MTQASPDPRPINERRTTIVGSGLPGNHADRNALNHEVHARPPEPITAPARVSYLALYCDRPLAEKDMGPMAALAERYNVEPPPPGANHFVADLGPFRVKWERHTEFMRYTFFVSGVEDDPFANPAISVVPEDWLATLQGEVLIAAHVVAVQSDFKLPNHDTLSQQYFDGNVLVGSAVGGGQGKAFTDFQVDAHGFSRFVVQDLTMTDRQIGRTVQRLLEIDTYRIMALLALPVARSISPALTKSEQDIASITMAMSTAGEDDEPALLDRLTRLQAAIESRYAETHFRFSAAAAYYGLVKSRIDELRENRIEGLPLFEEFVDRRLAPAMNTCQTMGERQNALSRRVARATTLLSTRVEMGSRRQNHDVLESLNRRAKLQLRLQETVEGLSVAAVTYYGVGLIGYLAKGLGAAGIRVNAELAMGISVPIIAILVAFGVRKVRKHVNKNSD